MGPEELARYRLRRVLGRGGAPGLFGGEVWEAEDSELPRRVVLKILRVDDESMLMTQARFVRDADTLCAVRHPNVMNVLDAGEAAGTSFVVMDLVRGTPITSAARAPGVTREHKLRWVRDAALGVAAFHEAGVAHRDVKPANVLVREDGSACLVDLGVPSDDRDDATEMLDDQAAWAAVVREVFERDMPQELSAVVDRAAAEDRAMRFSSMRELVAMLYFEAPPEAPPETPAVSPQENAAPESAVVGSDAKPADARSVPPPPAEQVEPLRAEADEGARKTRQFPWFLLLLALAAIALFAFAARSLVE